MAFTSEQEDAAHQQAAARVATSATGIGAAYVGEITEPDRDGWRGVVAVTDATGAKVLVMIAAAGHTGFRHMPVDGEVLASLVERYAGTYPVESRLPDLQTATSDGPGIRLDRSYPHEWDQATRLPQGQEPPAG